MITESLTNWWQSTWSQVDTIASYILPNEMKSIASSVLSRNMSPTSPFPLHVCQQHRSWIISWPLTTSGLDGVAIELYKVRENTILKIETEQGRILHGVQGFVSLIRRAVNLPDIPITTETAGSKTIITLQLKEGIFCDCSVNPSLESEVDQLTMRIMPDNPGKYYGHCHDHSLYLYDT